MPSWIPVALFTLFPVVMAVLMMRRFINLSRMIQNPEQLSELMATPEIKRALKMADHDPEATELLHEAFKTAIRNGSAKVINGNGSATLTLSEDDLSESTIAALKSLKHKREIEALQNPKGPSSLVRFVIAIAVIGGFAVLSWFLGIA